MSKEEQAQAQGGAGDAGEGAGKPAKGAEEPGKAPEQKPAKTFTEDDLKKAQEKEREKFKDYDDLKKRLADMEKAQLDEREKAILEAKESVKGEFEPKVKNLEATLQEILDVELADVPKEFQELIPDLPLEQKVAFVRKGKAAGMFSPQKATSSTAIPPGQTPPAREQKTDNKDLAEKDPQKYAEALRQKHGIRLRLPF